ncbi:MAG: AbrB/MazE/SpoVT family DNA-binding domain-containing protein [Nitrososphaerales archaeon]|nr:AbrB/MazE/SpoVT family DNA-binding domain-containing protein [Nitrososphaerales archaeon]
MRVGEKGQVVIPKDVREKAGIREGTDVTVEFRNGEVVVRRLGAPTENYVDYFLSTYSKKLDHEVDVEEILEEEHLERFKRLR